MSILVTGGTGFIGAQVVRTLLERGKKNTNFAPPVLLECLLMFFIGVVKILARLDIAKILSSLDGHYFLPLTDISMAESHLTAALSSLNFSSPFPHSKEQY
jgi:hypothetical protein